MRWNLVHSRYRHLSRQIRVDLAAVVGVRGRHELPLAETEQVIFPQQTANPACWSVTAQILE